MKTLALALLLTITSFAAQAEEIRSQKTTARVARVVEMVNLAKTNEIQVNVTVVDLGGSTDLSPTQEVYFTLYAKGEMFSTDAAFLLGHVLSFNGAKRVAGGIYEISVTNMNGDGQIVDQTFVIDARNAIVAMKSVDCGGDFDCDASEKFRATITKTLK